MDTVIDNGGAQVTSLNAGNRVQLTDADGKQYWISENDLRKSLVQGMDVNAMVDGVFIMYHRKSDGLPLMVKPHKWTILQSSGDIADGVVIVEGGKILVVAPTERVLLWSSSLVVGGGVITTNRLTSLGDWEGRANTTAQVTKPECSSDSYAPGFCNSYSRTNANGDGLTAGQWWLPSVGEMMCIYANMTKVNYALSLISGATQLSETVYWTSTEYSAGSAWILYLSDGVVYGGINKTTNTLRARPVSAFIQ